MKTVHVLLNRYGELSAVCATFEDAEMLGNSRKEAYAIEVWDLYDQFSRSTSPVEPHELHPCAGCLSLGWDDAGCPVCTKTNEPVRASCNEFSI